MRIVFESLSFIAFYFDPDGWYIRRTVSRRTKEGIHITIDHGHNTANNDRDRHRKDQISSEVVLLHKEIPYGR